MTALHKFFTVDLAYQVTANGDVVTSDGLMRFMLDEHVALAEARAEKAGRKPTFRKPTPEEAKSQHAMNDRLAKSFAEFKEKNAS